jgi:hypothetical protein
MFLKLGIQIIFDHQKAVRPIRYRDTVRTKGRLRTSRNVVFLS